MKVMRSIFQKKDSFWYNIEKSIGKDDYGGYIIYEVYIPKSLFTTSFNPKEKNKIVKITPDNINEFNDLLKKSIGKYRYYILKKRNIIGVDATANFIANRQFHKYLTSEEAITMITPEGYIWSFPKSIKIKKIEVYDAKQEYKKYKQKYVKLKNEHK